MGVGRKGHVPTPWATSEPRLQFTVTKCPVGRSKGESISTNLLRCFWNSSRKDLQLDMQLARLPIKGRRERS